MAKLSNSPKQALNFDLERRKSFTFRVRLKYSDGSLVNLTGCTLRFVMKSAGAVDDHFDLNNLVVNSEATIGAPHTGEGVFAFQAAELDGDPGEYDYSIVLWSPDNFSTVLTKGVVNLLDNCEAHSMHRLYSATAPTSALELTLRGGDVVEVEVVSLPQGPVSGAASTHTHTASNITDFTEATQDIVGAMIVGAGGTYDDGAGTITLAGGGGGGGATLLTASATLTGPYTVDPGTWPADQVASLVLTQDATGGHVVSWAASCVGMDGTVATLPAVPTSPDSVTLLALTPLAGRWVVEAIYSGLWPTVADTVAPLAGVLSVTSKTHAQIAVSVSGASDETAMHATPYAYSQDGGATWTAWQAASTYTHTGLAASTSYTLRHKVRDAAGHETLGSTVTQVTDAAPVVATAPDAIAGLYTHYDLSDAAKVTVTGGNVTAIVPAALGSSPSTKTGAGTQSLTSLITTGGTLAASTVNGLPAVRVPALSKIVSASYPTPQPSFATGATIFHVFKVVGDIAGGSSWTLGGLPNAVITQGGYSKWRNDAFNKYAGPASVSDTWTVGGGVYVQISVTNATAGGSRLYRSNRAAAGLAFNDVPAPGTHYYAEMVGGKTISGEVIAGDAIDHCQWGVYDRALTAAEVAGLMSYLKTKWGVA